MWTKKIQNQPLWNARKTRITLFIVIINVCTVVLCSRWFLLLFLWWWWCGRKQIYRPWSQCTTMKQIHCKANANEHFNIAKIKWNDWNERRKKRTKNLCLFEINDRSTAASCMDMVQMKPNKGNKKYRLIRTNELNELENRMKINVHHVKWAFGHVTNYLIEFEPQIMSGSTEEPNGRTAEQSNRK